MWRVYHPQSPDVAGTAAVVPVLSETILHIPAQLSAQINAAPEMAPANATEANRLVNFRF